MRIKTFGKTILLFIAFAVFALCIWLGGLYIKADDDTPVAGDNIYIENINVAGKNAEELDQVIQQKMAEYGQGSITINVGEQSTSILVQDMGIYQENTGIRDKILNLGKRGNIWQRIKMEHYFQTGEPIVFGIDLAVSEDAIRSIVENNCSALNIQRQDMGIYRGSDGQLYPTGKTDGLYVDVEATYSRLLDYMNNEWHGGYGMINAVTIDDPAAGDYETYSQVNSILGSGTTNYDTSENYAARNTNLAIGAAKISGITLNPGEEFSAEQYLAPFTTEAGYVEAGVYLNGKTVEDIGGGICQITSTLYRAVLEAELEVTERCEHSMIVGYVEPSMDASVSEGIKDFKFVNNSDAPIYIEGYAADGVVHFDIYGHETRDPARTLGFESEIYNETEIKTSFKLDDTLDFGLVEASQGHKGMVAAAFKIVYMNGEEVSREKICTSEYKESDQEYTIGTKGATASQISNIQAAADRYDLNGIYQIVGWSGGTV